MPCEYEIFPAQNLVMKRFWGRVTARCVLRMLDDIEEDSLYREGMVEFDDLSELVDLAITASEISEFAGLITGLTTRRRRPTRKAIFAPHGPGKAAAHGFCKMVEGCKDFKVAAFDDCSEAMAFLGLSGDPGPDRLAGCSPTVH